MSIAYKDHRHFVMGTLEPRQRVWIVQDHRQPLWGMEGTSTGTETLTVYYARVDGIRHPQKVLDSQKREWNLSDNFRSYLTEELRRDK